MGGVGNLAGVAVGVVTDRVFQYDASAVKSGGCAPEEAQKLGMGMFLVCNVAWAICFCVYLGMHCTYPKDRRRQLALHGAETKDSLECKAGETSQANHLDLESTGSRE